MRQKTENMLRWMHVTFYEEYNVLKLVAVRHFILNIMC